MTMIRFPVTNTIIACTCMALRSVLLVIVKIMSQVLYDPFIYYCINIGCNIGLFFTDTDIGKKVP